MICGAFDGLDKERVCLWLFGNYRNQTKSVYEAAYGLYK